MPPERPPRTFTEKLSLWLHCARPKTLPAALCPVVIGLVLAAETASLDGLVGAATLLAAVLIQVGTNLANDYFDHQQGADTAHRVGPLRATAAGLIRPGHMLAATVLVFVLAILVAVELVRVGGIPILMMGLVSIACGILYTAGPFPLGYLGLGELFVLAFFGPVAVSGTYYLQRGQWPVWVSLVGLGPGLISCAILVVNNYRDRWTDATAGKRTLVVRFGARFGRLEYAFALFGGVMIPLIVAGLRGHWGAWLAVVSLVPVVGLVRRIGTDPPAETLNRMLGRTGGVLVLFTVVFAIGWSL